MNTQRDDEQDGGQDDAHAGLSDGNVGSLQQQELQCDERAGGSQGNDGIQQLLSLHGHNGGGHDAQQDQGVEDDDQSTIHSGSSSL